MLNDPEKMEREAVTILNTVPAYAVFMAKYSMLASLFQLPAGYGSGSASTQGLQTQSQVQQLLQNQAGGGGGAQAQQQLQSAQSQMTSMQNAVSMELGGKISPCPIFNPIPKGLRVSGTGCNTELIFNFRKPLRISQPQETWGCPLHTNSMTRAALGWAPPTISDWVQGGTIFNLPTKGWD
jgi:hypothetical protein